MTPELAALLEVSTRIREYEVAASTIECLARLISDGQVQASLRQVALELYADGARWRRRQDASFLDPGGAATPLAPPGAEPPPAEPWTDSGTPQTTAGQPPGSYARHIMHEVK